MGCDIHAFAERRNAAGKFEQVRLKFFDFRSYGIFAFLAGVRNYSDVTPISEPRGLPEDAGEAVRAAFEYWGCDAHTPSWLTLEELLAFNYDAMTEDRRVMRRVGPNSYSGACTCKPSEGKTMTWRQFLGEDFFKDLNALADAGAERIVFWFDN